MQILYIRKVKAMPDGGNRVRKIAFFLYGNNWKDKDAAGPAYADMAENMGHPF